MRLLFLPTLLLSLCLQTGVEAATPDIPEIVITPTKTARALDEIPYAATRLDKETIEQDQPQSIDDIVKDVPNIDAAGGPRSSSEEPNIRGLSDRRIVIKIDGIRRNFRAQYAGRYFIDPWMIDSGEIVRGANSTIDGSGAIGGVVQFFTPDARKNLRASTDLVGGKIQTGYQSANNAYAALAEGYTATKEADVLAAASFKESGALRTGAGTKLSPGDTMPRNYLSKVGYMFNDKTRSEIRVSAYDEKADMPVNPFQPLSASNSASTRRSRVQDVSFRQTLKPENTAYSNLIDTSAILYHTTYTIDSRRASDQRFDETDFKTTGLDINNTSRFALNSTQNTLTLGVEYYADDQSGKRNGSLRALLGEGQDSNLGFYAQNEIALATTGLTLTPGLRFDSYTVTPGNAALSENNATQFSPKLGLNYKMNDQWSAYASLAQAFRTPTLTELYATGIMYPGNTLLANPTLKQETALDKEIGLRFKQTDLIAPTDRARVALSLFHNAIDDYIEEVSGLTTTQSRNVAKATLIGGEIETRYTLFDTTLALATGYVRGQNETSNEPLSDVPATHTTLSLEKFFPSPDLSIGARTTYYAPQTRVPPDQASIFSSSSATLIDLYASWKPSAPKLQGLEIRFGVDNLIDTSYRRYLSFLPDSGRNLKTTLTYRF